jgi:hypothetical protein
LSWTIFNEFDPFISPFLRPYRCKEQFRMTSGQIIQLCDLLRPYVHETPKLPLLVQECIFLEWIGFDKKFRTQRQDYKLSHELIKRSRKQIAQVIVRYLYPLLVRQPAEIPQLEGYRRMPFQGAIGCIDGCHFPIKVPLRLQDAFRNRKGYISTNAIGICDAENDLLFTYSLFGAEGSAPDSNVFYFVAPELYWIEGGYLVADAGFSLIYHRMLTPYRGVRYHLKE